MRTAGMNLRRHNRGAALIISLVLLVVLTVLGVASMQGTILQERMAGNFRESNAALQAAEAALRAAERFLGQASQVGPFNGSVAGLYTQATGLDTQINATTAALGDAYTEQWENGGNAWVALANPGNIYEGQAPQYMIEELRPYQIQGGSLAADEALPESQYFRITAQGFGASGSVVTLQSYFRRQ
jgi:type IV pilus assembly protein PilX